MVGLTLMERHLGPKRLLVGKETFKQPNGKKMMISFSAQENGQSWKVRGFYAL